MNTTEAQAELNRQASLNRDLWNTIERISTRTMPADEPVALSDPSGVPVLPDGPPSDSDKLHGLAATLRALPEPEVRSPDARAVLDATFSDLDRIAEVLEAFGR